MIARKSEINVFAVKYPKVKNVFGLYFYSNNVSASPHLYITASMHGNRKKEKYSMQYNALFDLLVLYFLRM